ncbi:MAG TPA: signal peptidase I [Patescibacteria group bacterium]|nr:signal peptidase I [Patescibacteria group bacterium]
MDGLKRIVAAIFDFLQGIVVVLAVLVMIYLFIMSPQEVNGASMEPNFHNGEYILTNKIEYKFREPHRGDVIIFKSWSDKNVDYIKRVIGLPGDTVQLNNNAMYVNGEKLDENYLASDVIIFGGSFLQEGQTITVPPDMYFVCGDNRPHSSDSREFGPVAKDDIVGTVIFRYWPFSQFGTLTHPVYNIN